MDFDKSRVYTAVNADELEVGDIAIVADTLADILQYVEEGSHAYEIEYIKSSGKVYRFGVKGAAVALAYLIAKHDDPYKEFRKAQAEGKDIWYKAIDGSWKHGHNYSLLDPIDHYSLTDPTKEYKVFLEAGAFVYTSGLVPNNAHVYFTTTVEAEALSWCTEHNKFADVAKAWEEGATIEYRTQTGHNWHTVANPAWSIELEYRVKPASLKWTDLKVGDVIHSKDGNSTAMVTQIDIEDRTGCERHISIGFEWLDNTKLAEWEIK